MKECSTDLALALNGSAPMIYADLYILTLTNGAVYRLVDYDEDVVWDNAVYSHDRMIIKRDQTKSSGMPSVDTLSVTISVDKSHLSDMVDGQYFMAAVHDGKLDDAVLSLARCFMDADGTVLGVLNLFTGRCEVSGVGGIKCRLNVKSETVGLNALFPLRTFAPQNVYQESSGTVSTASTDAYTCMIPFKPSKNVLVRL